ncbi:MAG: YicC family protein [Spirochaetales bacterium]|nr:YicC family protein [Spirochaetales bacterium]
MLGMTGYSFYEEYYDDVYISTEIRTVNHRFLELNLNTPFYLANLESKMRDLIQSRLKRGKVDVFIRIKAEDNTSGLAVNKTLAKHYYNALQEIASVIPIDINSVSLTDIARYDEVITPDKTRDYSEYWDKIEKSLNINLDEVIKLREHEGCETKKDLVAQVDKIEECVTHLCEHVPEMERTILENIKTKLNELIGDKVDQNKLLTEAGIQVSRACINEELERLKMHILKVREVFASEIDVGKRIDFLCQEMHREINTTGSKITDARYTDYVIIVKNCIEKIREQIRNIE